MFPIDSNLTIAPTFAVAVQAGQDHCCPAGLKYVIGLGNLLSAGTCPTMSSQMFSVTQQ
jgi:hypothetical protein